MQTIKCVVVGDGAVGKVYTFNPQVRQDNLTNLRSVLDLSIDILHHEQIPKRICTNCMYDIFSPQFQYAHLSPFRSLITMRSLS